MRKIPGYCVLSWPETESIIESILNSPPIEFETCGTIENGRVIRINGARDIATARLNVCRNTLNLVLLENDKRAPRHKRPRTYPLCRR